MLLLSDDQLPARRVAAAPGGPLAPLADALAGELEPLIGREPFVPAEKARLSRVGGRCPADGAMLVFDPYAPRAHRCPVCGAVYDDEAHYRWWIMGYQLWLAERAVHAALLHALRGRSAHGALARDILARYVERYPGYPNRDNVLGPSRVFFSTYLESIWVLQVAVALDLLEATRSAGALGGRVRERVLRPAGDLIAGYDEGASNRQVWNNAALLAIARLLDDHRLAERALRSPSGLVAHLGGALLPDGSWYEGENYHLFAHRGLWYGLTMAEVTGEALPAPLVARFQEGFATPFVTALPDFTFPARRDSQYAVSLRQWRFAEMAELGLARHDDARLRGALHTLYTGDLPRRDTGRARSTSEAERNEPASALSRADLGWRSLLRALPELPPLAPWAPRSALLEAQGYAMLRREGGAIYAALDYGHSGGGHGHPDRLNLILSDGRTRWLDDMGTGSYVERALHWYRSTLAHNAPLVDGHSQRRVHGALLAFDERGAMGWVEAEVAGIAPGVRATRTLVAMPDYLVEQLMWRADQDVVLDLPLHVAGTLHGTGPWRAVPLEGGTAPEDGFDFLRDTAVAVPEGDAPVRIDAERDGASATVWVAPSERVQWWRATAPGEPGHGTRPLFLVRMAGRGGALTTVWSTRGAVREVGVRDGALLVDLADGTRHEHARVEGRWRIDLRAGDSRSSVELDGRRARSGTGGRAPVVRPVAPPPDEPAPRAALTIPRVPLAPPWPRDVQALRATDEVLGPGGLRFDLGERHYRRSEESWAEAGEPTARVVLAADRAYLYVDVGVTKPDLVFAPGGRENDMDNEHPDINSDGLQLYLVAPEAARGLAMCGWLMVPEPDGTLRTSAVAGMACAVPIDAEWRPVVGGWAARCRIPLDALGGRRLALDLLVNEIAPGRERRRGQLVLGGAEGEFVYLRGDREDPARFLPFIIADA